MPSRPLTWLITGCSSGLGLSLTRYALSHGQRVIATSRQPSRTPDLVAEVQNKGGEWHVLNVDDLSATNTLVESLEASGKHIDVLVNNAGSILFGAVEQLADEELRRQMETLYFGPSRLIRAVIPRMRERRFGIVVNISSGAALDGRDSMGGYAAAKAALDGMSLSNSLSWRGIYTHLTTASSRVLAKEVAPFNVRLLTVWLGTLNTSIGGGSTLAQNALPEDYRGSVAEMMMNAIATGNFPANGDKDKAAKSLFEAIVGEGIGAGHEGEQFLPLGHDMIPRVTGIRDQCAHVLDVFGDVAQRVQLEKK